ncbi:hypothetical protein IWZ03DRAFT_387495 [Phyllosticta citriasiana]|uniref:Uncharacterized protein n=1 Tax=Phyllosticta citriasiana TaxID=595635 RepID=A0ABR1KAZ5_9PEZI
MPRSPSHVAISPSPRNRPSYPVHLCLIRGKRTRLTGSSVIVGTRCRCRRARRASNTCHLGPVTSSRCWRHFVTNPSSIYCRLRRAATEFSPVTFECRDVVGQMLPPNETTKTYSRKKKNASVSDRSHEESHSGDEASNEARGAPTLKRKRPAAKPTKRRLPTTRQLTLIPSSVFQETDTDPDAKDEHLTPANDPIEDAYSTAREKALGACCATKAKARKMTLTSLEKQFRPSKPAKLTADLSAFKIPKAQQKSAISVGDGFAPSEMTLPARTKRPRRDRRLYFKGAGTLEIVAGPLPAPHPLEVNRARQSCDPLTIQRRQILSAASDGPFNVPTASERLQPSPTPSQHSRELNQKFVTASLLPRTQREVNDRTKSDYQHDEMSMGSPSPGPHYEDAQSREHEEKYAEIMGIVPEDDHEFSDVENMQPQSAANKSIGRNENERNEMLAESDTQQEPEDVLFNHLDSSCPGQKARMESSGLWMEVNEDIEGSPAAPNRRLGDESQLFGRNGQQHRSASKERPAYVDPIELDFRTSSRALKGSLSHRLFLHAVFPSTMLLIEQQAVSRTIGKLIQIRPVRRQPVQAMVAT